MAHLFFIAAGVVVVVGTGYLIYQELHRQSPEHDFYPQSYSSSQSDAPCRRPSSRTRRHGDDYESGDDGDKEEEEEELQKDHPAHTSSRAPKAQYLCHEERAHQRLHNRKVQRPNSDTVCPQECLASPSHARCKDHGSSALAFTSEEYPLIDLSHHLCPPSTTGPSQKNGTSAPPFYQPDHPNSTFHSDIASFTKHSLLTSPERKITSPKRLPQSSRQQDSSSPNLFHPQNSTVPPPLPFEGESPQVPALAAPPRLEQAVTPPLMCEQEPGPLAASLAPIEAPPCLRDPSHLAARCDPKEAPPPSKQPAACDQLQTTLDSPDLDFQAPQQVPSSPSLSAFDYPLTNPSASTHPSVQSASTRASSPDYQGTDLNDNWTDLGSDS